MSSISAATAIVQLQHLRYNILFLRLYAVGVLEQMKGKGLLCDNDTCPIEWLHFDCVGLTRGSGDAEEKLYTVLFSSFE